MQKCVALFLWPNVQLNTTIMNCSAPWRGLHIRTNGDILTCCAGQKSLGNIHKDKLEDVLNGPMIKEVRKSIKNGKLHKDYCSRCIEIKKTNVRHRGLLYHISTCTKLIVHAHTCTHTSF